MKKILLSLVFLAFSYGLSAQMIIVSVPTITANPGEIVNVPVVMVSGASSTGTPIGACDVNITYNNVVLTYIGLVNFYPGMPSGEWVYSGNLSMVAANWIEPTFGTEAIPDGTTLFEMQFTYNVGNSDLIFTKNEFYDVVYELIPTTPINGAVNAAIVDRAVTFRVDMSRETVSPDGIHLAGSFNSWNYSANPMTDDGSGVYSATLQLAESTEYTYRFINGNNVNGSEIVPAECGILNGTGVYDRLLELQAADSLLDLICFSRCTFCPPLHDITFRVDMINQVVSADGVHLAGSFNNWNYSSIPMTLTGGGAVYEATLQLEEGQYYEFKFANGNSIQDAEIVPIECSTNGNRYFTVPAGNLVLDTVCFAECSGCGSVPQFYSITFKVDMKNETVSADGIHIAGSFQGWQPGTTPMADAGNNIYTYTTTLLEGTSIEYRLVNGITTSDYETVPETCSLNGNRFFNTISADTVLALVCFAECDTCPQHEVMVTFRVDLSEETVISPDGIHLAGTFQGWDPASTLMVSAPFNIYSLSLSLPVGSYLEYRFVNGNTIIGYENVPSDCASNGNRYLTVPISDTLLTHVCFSDCEPCPDGTLSVKNEQKQMMIFPNPTSGQSNLSFFINEGGRINISVINNISRKVLELEDKTYQAGSYTIPFDTRNLPQGIYLVILSNDFNKEILKKKFIMQY